jgi:hypothetical protein
MTVVGIAAHKWNPTSADNGYFTNLGHHFCPVILIWLRLKDRLFEA